MAKEVQRMPDLSGYDLAERIRREAWGKDMTLIAITAGGRTATSGAPLLRGSITISRSLAIRTSSTGYSRAPEFDNKKPLVCSGF